MFDVFARITSVKFKLISGQSERDREKAIQTQIAHTHTHTLTVPADVIYISSKTI